jgi:hypothetical protein
MKALTHPEYRLPRVEALGSFPLFEHGTTAPMAVFGVDTSTGERKKYVVKCKRSGRMSPTSSAFEIIGAWMAMELGLPVAEPALVNLSHEFVETVLRGKDSYAVASQSEGINCASVYYSGYTNIADIDDILKGTLLETAQQIYVFDIFIANTDRGHQKPNIVFNGTDFLLYDHELAFSFSLILSFLRNPTPWILNDADRELYSKHIFYKPLKKQKPDLAEQVSRLQCFNTAFWDKVYATLPPEWIDEKVRGIAEHLQAIVKNHDYFADSLNKTFDL